LTEIDVKSTFKKKLDVDFRNSRILGACNPPYAYKALQMEKYIGVLLPCNVEVQQEHNGGDIEVTIVSPMETMMALENEQLAETALEITNKLNTVLNNL
jgi:uncharacterized protein (DUF302 family)